MHLVSGVKIGFCVLSLMTAASLMFFVHQLSNRYELSSEKSKVVDLVVIGRSKVILTPDMNETDTSVAFHRFISYRHVVCERSIRLGHSLDGGWDMCLSGPYHPQTPCLVYSFGFDDDVSKRFGCTVRAFDPSMPIADHRRGSRIWFYRIGIGGEDMVNQDGWTVQTLSSLLKRFDESNALIDYLKLDVENSEWESLEAAIQTKSLANVKQLAIEIHVEVPTRLVLLQRYRLMRRLEEVGFRRWHFALNFYGLRKTDQGFRSCCYEMVYVNTNFLDYRKAVGERIYYAENTQIGKYTPSDLPTT